MKARRNSITARARTTATIAVATVALLALAACGSGDNATDDDGLPIVRIDGIPASPSGVPVQLIVEEGLDVKHGFRLEYIEGDPAGGATPFLRGEYELGAGDAIEAAIFNGSGHDIVAFYPTMSHTASIVASAESGITSPEDLVGMRVGHFGLDSGTTQAIVVTLEDGWGIDIERDFELVESPPQVLPELLAQGRIDAMFNFEPNADRGIQLTDGRRVLSVAEYWNDQVDWAPPLAMVMAHRSWLRDNPDLARSIRAAYQEALTILNDAELSQFGEEPYASLLGLQDEGETTRLREYCMALPCYTNEWDDEDAGLMNNWITRMLSMGMLQNEPATPASETLESLLD